MYYIKRLGEEKAMMSPFLCFNFKRLKGIKSIKGQKSLPTTQFSNGAEASGTAKISQTL